MHYTISEQRYRLKVQKREFAATLAVQALPALHVGTLWQGFKGRAIENNQTVVGTQYSSSLVKLDDKENKLKGNEEIAMKNLSKRPSRNNDDMLKNLAWDEKDIGMMKRCQRKMSQTINSLTVPNSDKQNRCSSLKASFNRCTLGGSNM